jgi:hypothetical protein
VHGEREVLDDQVYIVGTLLEQLLKYRINPAAVGSLVVKEGKNRDRRGGFADDLRRAFGDVVDLGNLNNGELFSRALGEEKLFPVR